MRTSLKRTGWGRVRTALAVTLASLTWVSLAVTPARANGEDTLASLSLSIAGGGAALTLDDPFDKDDTSYATTFASDAATPAISLSATTTDSSAKIAYSVDAGAYSSDSTGTASIASIGLARGDNTLNIRVTPDSGIGSANYYSVDIIVKDSRNQLSALAITPTNCGALNPTFSSSSTTYTLDSACLASVTDLTIKWTPKAGAPKVRAYLNPEDSGFDITDMTDWDGVSSHTNGTTGFTVSLTTAYLGFTPNVLAIQVTQGDDAVYNVQRVYLITFFQKESVSGGNGGVASLDSLSLSSTEGSYTLSPSFDGEDYTDYTSGPAGVSAIVVRADKYQEGQLLEYRLNGGVWTVVLTDAGEALFSVSLATGSNLLELRVTGTDRATNKVYKITMSNSGSGGGGGTGGLTGLTCGTCTLSPAFDATKKGYTSTVASGVSSVTLTPSGAGTIACKVNGANVSSNCAFGTGLPVTLASGNNLVELTVTPNGGTASTYKFLIARGTLTPILASLTLTNCTLTGFAANSSSSTENTAISCTMTNANSSTTVTAAGYTGAETLSYAIGATEPSPYPNPTTTAFTGLSVGANIIWVKVVVGGATRSYKITVTRQGGGGLSALTLSSGGNALTFDKVFDKDIFTYDAGTVTTSTVLLTATRIDTTAAIALTVNGTAITSFTGTATSIGIKAGVNTLVITVTPSGGTAIVYTLTVKGKACKVPNVVGLSFKAAKTALKAAGCGWTVTRVSSSKAKGTVLSQSPAFNPTKPKANKKGIGFKVVLTVSKGSAASFSAMGTKEPRAPREPRPPREPRRPRPKAAPRTVMAWMRSAD